jgi:hypothetical protein
VDESVLTSERLSRTVTGTKRGWAKIRGTVQNTAREKGFRAEHGILHKTTFVNLLSAAHLCDRVHDLVEHVVDSADHHVSNHRVAQRADHPWDGI